ncbi:indolepyruvate ferredoxin oxidoreductase subunit alpha [bacterium]|nr:indolepyruvate ferredoxin oxidoreductase subunit alpha [Candidatus Atribacteria bacterium]MBU4562623.1 indolepyruvate ferredoxin oxidoreductase subunit alpha [bacterium]
MKVKEILTEKEGEKLFLLGNEAAVRGALEGGVSVVSTYPGTPSSEIGNVFYKIAREAGVYFEFSSNEKVALEVSVAAAAAGLRSFVFMKHVGLNVAADSFMSAVYTGVRGGMIVLSADDPSMYSSQNEQDNRIMARLAGIPLLEPSNPQEVKDLMKFGFDLSEQFKIPVLMRTTTRISHMRGVVNLGTVIQGKEKGYFKKDPSQFIVTPAYAVKMRKELIKKLNQIEEKTENSPLNKIIDKGGREIGIITSGSAFNYVMDVVSENNLKVKILKLTFSYPFPEKLVLDFINSVDNILVAEEVEPVMEKEVLAIIGKYNIKKKVYGKLDGTLPRIYEYNPDIISFGMAKIVDKELIKREKFSTKLPLPLRSPVLCPGCPHRATYFALKKAIKKLKLKEEEIIYSTDIGCYALGLEPPYNMGDYCISMGSSLGIGCGFSKATNQKVISFIGDSTFFHAGIPPLVNAVHNRDKILLVVMDNRITGMTGGQTNPGVPVDGMGNPAPEVSIEKIARGVGAGLVKTIDPVDLKETEEVFKEALQFEGVAVVITKHPCAMITDAENRKKGISVKYSINQEECTKCLICVKNFTCPAIYIEKDGSVNINLLLCDGCGVCVQVCPKKAIEVKK